MKDRRSTRLVDYDYTSAGIYHITINTSKREKYFGEVENKTMALNELGRKADEFIQEIPIHYPMVSIHNHEVMPDHIHILIEIKDNGATRLKNGSNFRLTDRIGSRDTTCRVPTFNSIDSPAVSPPIRPFGSLQKNSISSIIGQYKASVTRWCNSNGHKYFAWQGRFHDQIIKDQEEFDRINKYISDNPSNWETERRQSEI
jgi:REP element-mobilizing transposase RayT